MSNEDKILLKETAKGISMGFAVWAFLLLMAIGSEGHHIDSFGACFFFCLVVIPCGIDGLSKGIQKARQYWLTH